LEIHVNEKAMLVEFWLTGAEGKDAALLDSLKPEFARWKAKKYLPVVYKSGTEDLYELTSALLTSNRDRAARRAAERLREPAAAPRPSVAEQLRRRPERPEKSPGKRRDDVSL